VCHIERTGARRRGDQKGAGASHTGTPRSPCSPPTPQWAPERESARARCTVRALACEEHARRYGVHSHHLAGRSKGLVSSPWLAFASLVSLPCLASPASLASQARFPSPAPASLACLLLAPASRRASVPSRRLPLARTRSLSLASFCALAAQQLTTPATLEHSTGCLGLDVCLAPGVVGGERFDSFDSFDSLTLLSLPHASALLVLTPAFLPSYPRSLVRAQADTHMLMSLSLTHSCKHGDASLFHSLKC
jgi:hypothetical protein